VRVAYDAIFDSACGFQTRLLQTEEKLGAYALFCWVRSFQIPASFFAKASSFAKATEDTTKDKKAGTTERRWVKRQIQST
jgi:hypothetical protein